MSAPRPGRVVMISGASRGIGAAVARHLAADGWTLSLGVRAPAAMGQPPGRDTTLVHGYDARDRESQKAWVETTVARFGRIDAVVANAGIMIPKSVVEAEDHEIDEIYDVNVMAPMRLVRAAWPWLTATGQRARHHGCFALGQAGRVRRGRGSMQRPNSRLWG